MAQRLVGAADAARRPRGRERSLVGGVLGVTTLFLGSPLAVLVWRSLHVGGHWSLGSSGRWGRARPRPRCSSRPGRRCATRSSSRSIATVIALVVGGLASVAITAATRPGDAVAGRAADAAARHLGGHVGFGFLVAFEHAPLGLATRLARADGARGGGGAVRHPHGRPRAAEHRPALRDAATMLGAAPRHVWREVDLPITAARVRGRGGLRAAVSLGEFGATLFIARPDWPTVPIAIQRFLARPGRDQRRPVARDVGDPHAADGGRRVRDRAGAGPRPRRAVDAARRRRGRASSAVAARSTRVDLDADAGETVAVLGPERVGQDDAAARGGRLCNGSTRAGCRGTARTWPLSRRTSGASG